MQTTVENIKKIKSFETFEKFAFKRVEYFPSNNRFLHSVDIYRYNNPPTQNVVPNVLYDIYIGFVIFDSTLENIDILIFNNETSTRMNSNEAYRKLSEYYHNGITDYRTILKLISL